MASYKNNIKIGVTLAPINEVKKQLNDIIKLLENNNKLNLKLNIDSSNLGFKDLTKAIDNMSKRFEELNKRSKEFTNSTKENSNAFRNAENSASSFGNTVKNCFNNLGLYMSTAMIINKIVGQFKEASDYLITLDKNITNIQMITGNTREEVVKTTQTFKDLGGELHTTNKEMMASAEELMRAGYDEDTTKRMIEASTIASKISGQTNAETSEQLIAIKNAFNMTGEEMEHVIDVMSKLDNTSATSFKEIASAIQRTAYSAQQAGTPFDKLASYITVVSEKTRKSADTIGESFKSIYSRFSNIKLGNLDEDGKSINDTETALNRIGIAIRSNKGEFRDFDEVLTEFIEKYKSGAITQVDYLAGLQALAGTRQRETLMALIENVDTLNQHQQDLANSTGSAKKMFEEAYSDSLDAKINDLKRAFEGLYETIMTSDGLKWIIEESTQLVTALSNVDGETIAFIATVGTLSLILMKLVSIYKELKTVQKFDNLSALGKFIGTLTGMNTASAGVSGLSAAFGLLTNGIKSATLASIAFVATPLGATITAIGVACGVAVAGFMSYKNHQKEVKQQTDDLRSSIQNLNTTLGEGNTQGVDKDLNTLQKQQEELKKYIQLLEDTKNKSESAFYSSAGGATKTDVVNLMTKKVNEYKKEIEDAGMTLDEYGNIVELTNAKAEKSNLELIDSIKQQTEEQLNNRNNLEDAQEEYDSYISTVKDLYSQYQELSSQENLSAEEKSNLSDVVGQLKDKFNNLSVGIDENRNAYIENTPLIEDNISYLESEGMTVDTLSAIRVSDSKVMSQWMVNGTAVTYSEISKRIQMYREEIGVIQALMTARIAGSVGGEETQAYQHMSIGKAQAWEEKDRENNPDEWADYDQKLKDLQAYTNAKNKIDELYNSVQAPSYSGGGGSSVSNSGSYMPSDDGSKGSSGGKSGKSDEEKAREEAEKLAEKTAEIDVDKYYKINNAIAEIDNALELNKTLQEDLYGADLESAKQQEIQLMKKKQDALVALNNQQQQELMLQRKILEEKGFVFNADGNIINQQEKLQELADAINNKTYENSEEGLKQKEDEIDALKELQDELKNYTDLNTSKIPSVTKQWRELNNEIKSGVLSSLKETIDKQKEMYELQLEEKNNAESKALEDLKNQYEEAHNQRLDELNEELDALEENNEEEERENTLLEKKNALKQAEIDLERAKNQKTVYSYKKQEDGTYQFSWEADKDAVKSAQDSYDSAKKDLKDTKDKYELEDKKKEIQEQIDEENKLYEAKQKEIEDYESALSESYERQKKLLDYYYQDTDKLAQESLNKLTQTYGDNFETISQVVNTKLDETKSKLDELNKANIGYDLETINKALSSENIYEYVTSIQEQTDKGVSINLEGLKQRLSDIETQNGNMKTAIETHYTTTLTTQSNYQTNSRNSQEQYQQEYLDSFILFSAQYVTLYDKMMQLIKMITDSGTNDIATMVQGAGQQVLNELIESKKAYDKFRDMWNYMHPDDTIPNVDISSVVSDFNAYKQSVTDWQKSKEELFYASNNPLYSQDKYIQLSQVGMTNFNALASAFKSVKGGETTQTININGDIKMDSDDAQKFVSDIFKIANQKLNTK